MLASCVAGTWRRTTQREGVVVTGEVVARKGDGASYAPAFRTPLHEGAEFRIAERRGDWLRIRLPDGRGCWIPAAAAETI
jgi:SH3-like domain-containing protein